ncbi:MAG TPA: phosphoribosylamine--glycine ligase, partial [Desulfobulbaceae bacterium]|nr:phosphoribosylamine--glycine ligase [Desulfobulbaceae bacterium]
DKFEALEYLEELMLKHSLGEAGNEVVIEEYIEGFEASILSFFNGKDISCMLAAKDYKKIGENNTGPNTGPAREPGD